MLDRPDFDRVATLRRHRDRLAAEVRRYRRLLKTLDATLAALEGEAEVEDKQLYKGFDPSKQAKYEAWLVDRYGPGMAQQISDSWMKASRDVDATAAAKIDGELKAIERGIGNQLEAGAPADADAVQDLVGRHHAIVSRFWSPGAKGYIGLGELYMEHPDFRARYEAVTPGLTEYLASAMKAYAETRLA